jgi:hypothetical protein
LAGRLIGSFTQLLNGSTAHWLIGLIAHLLIGSFTHLLIGSIAHRLIYFPCICYEVKVLFTHAPIQFIVNRSKTIMKYWNLFQQQWYIQDLVEAFNADEALWNELEIRRKLRRRVCSLREKEYKVLDLLEFEAMRPQDDCIGIPFVTLNEKR